MYIWFFARNRRPLYITPVLASSLSFPLSPSRMSPSEDQHVPFRRSLVGDPVDADLLRYEDRAVIGDEDITRCQIRFGILLVAELVRLNLNGTGLTDGRGSACFIRVQNMALRSARNGTAVLRPGNEEGQIPRPGDHEYKRLAVGLEMEKRPSRSVRTRISGL